MKFKSTALRPYPIQTKLEMRIFGPDADNNPCVSFQQGFGKRFDTILKWNIEKKGGCYHWESLVIATPPTLLSILESRTLSQTLCDALRSLQSCALSIWEGATAAATSDWDLYPFLRIITLGHILMNTLEIYVLLSFFFKIFFQLVRAKKSTKIFLRF